MEKNWEDSPLYFKSRIIGKLLGDGGITIQKGRKPRFQFIHSTKDSEWVYFCYQKLKDFLPLQPPKYRKVIDPRLHQGFSESIQCQSKTSPIITFLEKNWYKNRKKIIPFNQLEEHLNRECLAWWYQDDGHLKKDRNVPRKIILSTESFTSEENRRLIRLLADKFQINFSIDGKNRLVLYNQVSIHYFLYLVSPYTQKTMDRKQLLPTTDSNQTASKRTTISLPKEFKISQPTSQINNQLKKLDDIWSLYKRDLFYHEIFMPYSQEIVNKTGGSISYQIKINPINNYYLFNLKRKTGFTYSQLTHLCYLLEK